MLCESKQSIYTQAALQPHEPKNLPNIPAPTAKSQILSILKYQDPRSIMRLYTY